MQLPYYGSCICFQLSKELPHHTYFCMDTTITGCGPSPDPTLGRSEIGGNQEKDLLFCAPPPFFGILSPRLLDHQCFIFSEAFKTKPLK